MATLTFKSNHELQARTFERFLYALAAALAVVLISALLQVWPMFELLQQNGNQLLPIPDDAVRCIA